MPLAVVSPTNLHGGKQKEHSKKAPAGLAGELDRAWGHARPCVANWRPHFGRRHAVRCHIFCSEAISEHGPHGVEVDIVDSSLSVCQGVAPNADKRWSRLTGIEGGESLGRSLNEAPSFPLEMRIAILGLYTPRPSPDLTPRCRRPTCSRQASQEDSP